MFTLARHVEMEIHLEICSIVGPPYNVKHVLSSGFFFHYKEKLKSYNDFTC